MSQDTNRAHFRLCLSYSSAEQTNKLICGLAHPQRTSSVLAKTYVKKQCYQVKFHSRFFF